MKIKAKELRTKADFSLTCPDCATVCCPDDVTKLQRRKVESVPGVTVVLPDHYLDLHCPNCHLQLWVGVDENGKPLPYD